MRAASRAGQPSPNRDTDGQAASAATAANRAGQRKEQSKEPRTARAVDSSNPIRASTAGNETANENAADLSPRRAPTSAAGGGRA